MNSDKEALGKQMSATISKQMNDALSKARSLFAGKEMVEERPIEDKGYRSKLVVCIDILCSLVSNGPMNFTQLSHKIELDTIRLSPHLKLLIDRELIEQQTWNEKEIIYVITERGLKVLRVVNPIVKEAHKIQMRNFELISNTLSEAGL
jgi:predicted transcriptional regulator